MKIETNRLLLRPIEKQDAQAVFEYRSDAITNKYQGSFHNELKETEEFIEKCADVFNQADSWFQMVIILKNEIIGDMGIHFIDDEGKQVELGITLNKKFHNQGFANEAMTGIIDHLFNKLDKHRIIGSLDPANTSSIKLLKKLNFRQEAHFKESLFLNGIWVDDIVFALLKKEWK